MPRPAAGGRDRQGGGEQHANTPAAATATLARRALHSRQGAVGVTATRSAAPLTRSRSPSQAPAQTAPALDQEADW